MDDDVDAAIRRCLEGDPDSFGAIIEAYKGPIYNVALRMTGNLEDARDLTQAVLVKAFENLRRYDPGYRFFSWIYRIAFNESVNFLHRNRRPAPEASRSAPPTPEDQLSASERSHRVQQALLELSPDQRAVIVLRHFRDCAYGEMAEILGVPEKTVKSRLFSARRRLAEILAARGVR